ncbi:28S ribosomal protein S36, mitochondrial [Takifugu flavidus]|uniref:28S ribosomal protein S36, mitochondrial n=1 Tax=Takifugu flavidus TaxID=433684 RepID=A0A5C6MZ65_9TELE|nr:28S ribosomal protein S36, mitochondrial [Takifugu flavidus]
MGSKVSSKMAAPTARVLQVVRPHAPLIKFPNRNDVAKPNAQEALKALAVSFSPNNTVDLPSAPPPRSQPRAPLTPLPGTPDTLVSVQLLTSRYRRRPLALEEMEYIQVRGASSCGGA